MGKRARRRTQEGASEEIPNSSPKRLKKGSAIARTTKDGDPATQNKETNPVEYARPKSKKELRAEKKAARKRAEAVEVLAEDIEVHYAPQAQKVPPREEYKQEKQRLRKEQRKALLKEQLKEERQAKKLRQQRRLNREINAPKKSLISQQSKSQGTNTGSSQPHSESETKKKKKNNRRQGQSDEEEQVAKKILYEIKHGSKDELSGMTTLQMGVQYKDIVVGVGLPAEKVVKKGSLLTVSYKLTGGKFNTVIDSSKNFKFRVGKGEVIQGWDIGVIGMKQGGRRKLVVPPKAGYGSQDIGAGPGGILHFDITVLAII